MTDTATQRRGAEIHHSHRDVTGGFLRPAVFGAMDGVVSNISLISGVAAAAGHRTHLVVIAGLAGLLAGAFSMAVGEWTSVNSQVELVHAEIEKEQHELVHRPEAEQAELTALYVKRGLTRPLAEQVARELARDPDTLWRIHVREELGVDPDDLPSPYVAGGSSLLSFAAGAFLPLLPYLLGSRRLWISLVLAGVGLLVLGASVARFTERPAWRGALRQLMLGAVAAAITYGVGSAFGVGTS